MKYYILYLLVFLSCSQKPKEPHILIKTSAGDIEAELYPEKAPLTVAAFLKNIEEGSYKSAAFYRAIKVEGLTDDDPGILQGGIYGNSSKVISGIPHETTKRSGLSHTDGILSMARTEPGTASTEFFICLGDQTFLDSGRIGTKDKLGMAAFGKVVSGMNIVRHIRNGNIEGDALRPPVGIIEIIKL